MAATVMQQSIAQYGTPIYKAYTFDVDRPPFGKQ